MGRVAIILASAAILFSGCASGVDSWPRPAANDAARASIAAGGGDPGRWIVSNHCGASGTCGVGLAARCAPRRLVAVNRYRIKDSFPTLLGGDRIRRAAARSPRCP